MARSLLRQQRWPLTVAAAASVACGTLVASCDQGFDAEEVVLDAPRQQARPPRSMHAIDEAVFNGTSVLLWPSFVSPSECDRLVAAARAWEARTPARERRGAVAEYGGGATTKLCVPARLDAEVRDDVAYQDLVSYQQLE